MKWKIISFWISKISCHIFYVYDTPKLLYQFFISCCYIIFLTKKATFDVHRAQILKSRFNILQLEIMFWFVTILTLAGQAADEKKPYGLFLFLKLMVHPFKNDIVTCSFLIQFLTRLFCEYKASLSTILYTYTHRWDINYIYIFIVSYLHG